MGIFLENNGIEAECLPLLMTGLEDNKTLEATRELKNLADIIRQEPRIKEIIGMGLSDYSSFRAALMEVPRGDYMIEYFESILTRYGHRRLSRDLISPSWTDDPMIPFGIVRDLVCQGEQRPVVAGPGHEDRRLAVQEDIESRLPVIKRRYFRTLSRYLARYTAFRELQRFYLDMILSRLRDLISEISTRMLDDDILKDTDDVHFLDMEDLLTYLKGRAQQGLQEKALFNRLTYENHEGSPGLFLRAGVDFNSVHEEEKVMITGQTINGQSISPGVYSGKVQVILDIDRDVKIGRGDIIVTRCLDPGQTHFLMMAGALILEVGGMLSHGAILARELGIPTVAQVSEATTLFKNGQSVVVNGTVGTVSIVT
jgi:pyruvate,water dikinase